MGRTWRTLAAAGALAAAGLAPGAALAATGDPAATEIYVAVVAPEGPAAPAGSVFDLHAQLAAGQDPVAGKPVTLLLRPAGAPGFTPARTVTSGADGSLDAAVRLDRSTAYRWDFAGDGDFAASTSHPLVQQVGSRVHARAARTVVGRHDLVRITGTTAPVRPGRRVSLWRGDKPVFGPELHMTRLAVGAVRSDGTLRLAVRFAHAGTKRLYVRVAGGGGNAPGFSGYLRVRVR
jgi:hypothetical protein